ncbi:MMPL family transporter [Patulibacter defluvii]|uniref:MMPL family transporter n=1 Tax=Patulibacter defluvii TaxID=3095358 RepID=UPI002A75F17F|nr:MMPL family transporter [Patulibacter sp. DM4]
MSGTVGPIGRLGRWTATHFRAVALAWAVIAVALGALAPQVEHALSGAGWEATGSESVQARDLLDREFGGRSSSALTVVLHSDAQTVRDGGFRQAIAATERTLSADPRGGRVLPPQPGTSVSRDGRTAIVQATAAASSNEMVRAADDLKGKLPRVDGVQAALTGASGMWSDFNTANRDAMMKSELLSWPVTLVILVLAFGSLVAAGLPLMLTILGLVASAGTLYLGTQLLDISIWAMNFALMFALALGIDYALFVVMRFRAAFFGSGRDPVDATAETMDTAGKAVLFSGLTVLISLTAVMLVPSPAFRSMALGIMISVLFVLAATLTLLPAVLAKLGPRIDRAALPWARSGEHRSPRFAAWAARLWRRPLAFGAIAVVALLLLAAPVLGLRTGMPSIKVVPEQDGSRVGYGLVQQAFGDGAPGALQVVVPRAQADRTAATLRADRDVAGVLPAVAGDGGHELLQATLKQDPSAATTGAAIDRIRDALPRQALVGGSVAENHDLEATLTAKTPLVLGVVLALGFLLLLFALRAPVVALIGTVTNLLAVAAAFGVARLVFQEGHGAGLLGFEPQGFLDAWAPVFFFAMVFAISMDYTVFLLSSAKEHWDRSHDPREAMVGGLAHSGRVIFAAAAVMVAVFFTFALSGPLPPKEMGVILGVAVLLDAFLVRLLLVPVLLRLTGRWAWWLPAPLDRLLPDVRFGHA